jgi:endonuclease/exonuclease/phosphatase family metal-dependent hydrolase
VTSLPVRKTLLLLVALGAGVALTGTPAYARPDGPGPALVPPALTAYPRTGVKAAVPVRSRPVVPVKVMSFNVCGGVCRKGEVARTASYVARVALRHKASVVLLQELCNDQYVRIRDLLAADGYTGRFAAGTKAGTCGGKGFGVAVLARGRTVGQVVERLPVRAGQEGRVMLGTTAYVGGRRTFVVVVHLSPSPAAGLAGQLRRLAEDLNARRGPVIVGGDFNALPGYAGMSRFYGSRFVEADELRTGVAARSGEPTFDVAGRKIDYVFLTRKWFAQPTAVSIETPMSDHRVYISTARVHQP